MQIDILDRMQKEIKNLKKKLRSPLNLWEIVYILLARIKKKKTPHPFSIKVAR